MSRKTEDGMYSQRTGTHGLSRPVRPDNNGNRALELNDIRMLVVESPDPSNGELVEGRPT
jgi:hypothetical protein